MTDLALVTELEELAGPKWAGHVTDVVRHQMLDIANRLRETDLREDLIETIDGRIDEERAELLARSIEEMFTAVHAEDQEIIAAVAVILAHRWGDGSPQTRFFSGHLFELLRRRIFGNPQDVS